MKIARSGSLLAAVLVAAAVLAPALASAGEPAASFSIVAAQVVAKVGQAAVAQVVIKAAPGYHLNKDFPTSLKLDPTAGIDLPKPKLLKADAKLSEMEGSFDVALTAREAGKKTIAGVLAFAVCTATTCDPQRVKVAIAVDAR
ncbi:MAG: hypothetical protein EXR72_03670 [Myxococcales bacterium]|nr:hypothetical protein [Myxococcales bacterium]